MGRGAYDTSDAGSKKSSAGQYAIFAHHASQAQAAHDAETMAAVEREQKLKRSKKSRGIKAAKHEAVKQAEKTLSACKTKSLSNDQQV